MTSALSQDLDGGATPPIGQGDGMTDGPLKAGTGPSLGTTSGGGANGHQPRKRWAKSHRRPLSRPGAQPGRRPQHTRRPSVFFLHWQLAELPTFAADYASALTVAVAALARQPHSSNTVVCGLVAVDGLIALSMEVRTTSLESAIERGRRRLFEAIEVAGVEEPGRLELVAGGLLR